ncbi:MAG: hypothetical protein COC01_02250 [Bacteroidetes bacterium]|nr:MAG: hypothetical protein COC01_02250 [Bacteroidota bacterium]
MYDLNELISPIAEKSEEKCKVIEKEYIVEPNLNLLRLFPPTIFEVGESSITIKLQEEIYNQVKKTIGTYTKTYGNICPDSILYIVAIFIHKIRIAMRLDLLLQTTNQTPYKYLKDQQETWDFINEIKEEEIIIDKITLKGIRKSNKAAVNLEINNHLQVMVLIKFLIDYHSTDGFLVDRSFLDLEFKPNQKQYKDLIKKQTNLTIHKYKRLANCLLDYLEDYTDFNVKNSQLKERIDFTSEIFKALGYDVDKYESSRYDVIGIWRRRARPSR